jgi:hypothetical protein
LLLLLLLPLLLQSFGKCSDGFIVTGNFCAKTCGRCGASGSQRGSGGRKLLVKQLRSSQ